MTGTLAGILFGSGLFMVWLSFWSSPETKKRNHPAKLRLEETLIQAGFGRISLRHFLAISIGLALFAAAISFLFFPAPALILVALFMAGFTPWLLAQSRARKRQAELRKLWPEIIEHLSSAIRAGLSLPEAIGQLGTRGPESFRPLFLEFAADYRVTGQFSLSLDRLKNRFADPIADRVIESLRLARDVGGNNLTVLLRSLTQFLHDDLRTRGELAARQSWTVAGARLAIAAPWAILLVLVSRPEAASAYATSTGTFIILIGAGISLLAYRLMLHLGRLPEEKRVLR